VGVPGAGVGVPVVSPPVEVTLKEKVVNTVEFVRA
jgi:hypothetical protein